MLEESAGPGGAPELANSGAKQQLIPAANGGE
jgi:hypothetical protein